MTALQTALSKRQLRLADLARLVAVDKSTVTRWARKVVPAERVVEVERVTGISRKELRPDLYGPALETAG
jgi:DNA-binding transcriptional regulator YdaS (Cro superfamily)